MNISTGTSPLPGSSISPVTRWLTHKGNVAAISCSKAPAPIRLAVPPIEARKSPDGFEATMCPQMSDLLCHRLRQESCPMGLKQQCAHRCPTCCATNRGKKVARLVQDNIWPQMFHVLCHRSRQKPSLRLIQLLAAIPQRIHRISSELRS